MLNVNDFFPNCNFVSLVLYIYDYEAICMKFTPFQILKIALLKRIPALLNTVLINHGYRVDITFLLNSQWAGKLALPAITILISLVNVFIYKVPLPYLESFILFLLTKERAYLWELVINPVCNTMRPHRQATAFGWSSSFIINIHQCLLSHGALWASFLNFTYDEIVSILKSLQWGGYWSD